MALQVIFESTVAAVMLLQAYLSGLDEALAHTQLACAPMCQLLNNIRGKHLHKTHEHVLVGSGSSSKMQ